MFTSIQAIVEQWREHFEEHVQEPVPEISGVLETISVPELTMAVRKLHSGKAGSYFYFCVPIIGESHSSAFQKRSMPGFWRRDSVQ